MNHQLPQLPSFLRYICCFTFLSFDKTCQLSPRFSKRTFWMWRLLSLPHDPHPSSRKALEDVAYGMLKKRGTWYTHSYTNLCEYVAIICLHGLMNTYYKHNTNIINHLMHIRQNSLGSWLHISSSSNIHPLIFFKASLGGWWKKSGDHRCR